MVTAVNTACILEMCYENRELDLNCSHHTHTHTIGKARRKYSIICHYSSVGKESTCNAGDPDLITGLGRSVEKGQTNHFGILRLPLWLS